MIFCVENRLYTIQNIKAYRLGISTKSGLPVANWEWGQDTDGFAVHHALSDSAALPTVGKPYNRRNDLL